MIRDLPLDIQLSKEKLGFGSRRPEGEIRKLLSNDLPFQKSLETGRCILQNQSTPYSNLLFRMYCSKFHIDSDNKAFLLKKLKRFLTNHKKIYCKSLKRKVSLEMLPDAIIHRRDVKRRLQCFMAAVDILRNSPNCTKKRIARQKCFEIIGSDYARRKIFLHLREEERKKDKMVYLISIFWKEA